MNPNEFYPTDPDLALAITRRVALILGQQKVSGVVEPSAGNGAFIRAAKEVWPGITTIAVEIDPAMEPALKAAGSDYVLIGDWVDAATLGFVPGCLGLGNPPFSLAQKHIEAGISGPQPLSWMALLLRMSFMGSYERVEFWNKHPARWAFTLVPRPNFMKGQKDPETGKPKGGDNSEYAVYIWEPGYQGETSWLPPLVWKPRRAKH